MAVMALLMSGSAGLARAVTVAESPFSSGSLSVTNIGGPGTLNSSGAVIGGQGSGVATVHGPSSKWTNSGELGVGSEGTGILYVINGGAISNTSAFVGNIAGADGTVTVDGAGSTWTNSSDLYAGYSGTGAVKILGGGAVSGSTLNIGYAAGSNGSVTLDGHGSMLTTGIITVGHSGTGRLSITGGGEVSSTQISIGVYSGSTGSVSVADVDSALTNIGNLVVGGFGAGVLLINSGGNVSNANGIIGEGAGAAGLNRFVTVAGPDSTWNNTENLIVGQLGNGTLNILNGGSVSHNGDDLTSMQIGQYGEVRHEHYKWWQLVQWQDLAWHERGLERNGHCRGGGDDVD